MSKILEACIVDIVKRGSIPINIKSKIRPDIKPTVSIPEIKRAVSEILAQQYKGKIKSLSLFGSYSRGEATKSSDIDIFICPKNGFTAFDLVGLGNDLEKRLNKKVDIVTKGDNISESLLSSIKRDAIQIYEEQ